MRRDHITHSLLEVPLRFRSLDKGIPGICGLAAYELELVSNVCREGWAKDVLHVAKSSVVIRAAKIRAVKMH